MRRLIAARCLLVKFYADLPGKRARQLLMDLLVIVWVYAWVRLGLWLHDLVEKLAGPGRKLESAGNGLADNLSSAGSKIDNVPGVGGALSTPFNKAADAARSLASAGHDQQQIVGDLALALSLALVAVPLALVLFGWLPLRVRWVRRASAAAGLRGAVSGRDLLALRALATQPLRRLAALDPEIASAWRRGDQAAVDALATLELRTLGLRWRP
jgi:hypothetical protein